LEQKTWPSKVANFLKHADRNKEPPLTADEVNNEFFIMSACCVYLELMRQPSAEITAYFAFWAVKNCFLADIDPSVRPFCDQLLELSEPERYGACERYVRDAKSRDEADLLDKL